MRKTSSILAVALMMVGCATPLQLSDVSQDALTTMAETRQLALETSKKGQPKPWKFDYRTYGSVTVLKTYRVKNSTYCRRIFEQITVGIKSTKVMSDWCRGNDGVWTLYTK